VAKPRAKAVAKAKPAAVIKKSTPKKKAKR
jgi:hypothetical protein